MADLTPQPERVIPRLQNRLAQMSGALSVEADSWAALYEQAMEELEKAREEIAGLKGKSGGATS